MKSIKTLKKINRKIENMPKTISKGQRKVIARVRYIYKKTKELEQLERSNELKVQGLILFNLNANRQK
jgi:hypothetical protein